MPQRNPKKAIIVGIQIFVASLHFLTGPSYSGPYPDFVNGYLLDILIPFAWFFLLCLVDLPILKRLVVRGLLVLFVASSVEIAQLFGVPIFGRTFDPLDFLAYGAGILMAAVLEFFVFEKFFDFWTIKSPAQ